MTTSGADRRPEPRRHFTRTTPALLLGRASRAISSASLVNSLRLIRCTNLHWPSAVSDSKSTRSPLFAQWRRPPKRLAARRSNAFQAGSAIAELGERSQRAQGLERAQGPPLLVVAADVADKHFRVESRQDFLSGHGHVPELGGQDFLVALEIAHAVLELADPLECLTGHGCTTGGIGGCRCRSARLPNGPSTNGSAPNSRDDCTCGTANVHPAKRSPVGRTTVSTIASAIAALHASSLAIGRNSVMGAPLPMTVHTTRTQVVQVISSGI